MYDLTRILRRDDTTNVFSLFKFVVDTNDKKDLVPYYNDLTITSEVVPCSWS